MPVWKKNRKIVTIQQVAESLWKIKEMQMANEKEKEEAADQKRQQAIEELQKAIDLQFRPTIRAENSDAENSDTKYLLKYLKIKKYIQYI